MTAGVEGHHEGHALISILTCAALWSARADAEGPSQSAGGWAACLDAVSKGQTLQDAHRFVEARAQFQACARAACPGVVQSDCAKWVVALDSALPTVVISAKDDGGKDVLDVKVSVDGRPLVDAAAGQAVPVNPGLRTFRFERSDGSVVTQQSVVKEGEKRQSVLAVFSVPRPPSGWRWSTRRLVGVGVGGAGVVGAALGIGVAIDAKVRDNAAARESGPQRHTDSQSAANEGNVASAIVGVGAALAVAGVAIILADHGARVWLGLSGHNLALSGTF